MVGIVLDSASASFVCYAIALDNKVHADHTSELQNCLANSLEKPKLNNVKNVENHSESAQRGNDHVIGIPAKTIKVVQCSEISNTLRMGLSTSLNTPKDIAADMKENGTQNVESMKGQLSSSMVETVDATALQESQEVAKGKVDDEIQPITSSNPTNKTEHTVNTAMKGINDAKDKMMATIQTPATQEALSAATVQARNVASSTASVMKSRFFK